MCAFLSGLPPWLYPMQKLKAMPERKNSAKDSSGYVWRACAHLGLTRGLNIRSVGAGTTTKVETNLLARQSCEGLV